MPSPQTETALVFIWYNFITMVYEKTQQLRIDEGLCKDCGQPRGINGTTIRCRICANDASTRASNSKKKKRDFWLLNDDLCNQCGKEKDIKFQLCEDCKEKARERYSNTFLEQKEQRILNNVCWMCGKSCFFDSRLCQKHWLKSLLEKYKFDLNQQNLLFVKLEKQNFECFYTGVKLTPGTNCSIDHIEPRSKNGKINDPDNCVWVDRKINMIKNNMNHIEFVDLCKQIAQKF